MARFGLTDQQYQVCLLRFGHHMTTEQIGRKLGITRQAVEDHLAASARKYPALAPKRGHKGHRRQTALAG